MTLPPGRFDYAPINDRPIIKWPNDARVAFWVAPNMEFFEYLPENRPTQPDIPHYSRMDYGNRVGFWRMLDVLNKHKLRACCCLNLEILDHFPEIKDAMIAADWDYMAHGLYNSRPIYDLTEEQERAYWQDFITHLQEWQTPSTRFIVLLPRRAHTVLDMDPVRNPYAPGAGQRPPELAGRDTELSAFDVVLERIAHGRPERSLVLTGLRGVGQDGAAQPAALGGDLPRLGHRQDRGPARAVAAPAGLLRAAHGAARARPAAPGPGVDRRGARRPQGVRAAGDAGRRQGPRPLAAGHRRARRRPAGPTPATWRSTWSSCSATPPAWPPTSAAASPCSSTRCRTCSPTTSRRSAPPATSCRSRARR